MKLSIVIPIHEEMKGGADFLWRNIDMLTKQSFQDFELIISKTGLGMAKNINAGIKRAQGEIVKLLFLDDVLAHQDSLKLIVEAFDRYNFDWLITGCDNNPYPYRTDDIETGNNKLGSPSCLAFKNEYPLLFDEKMQWLLDCDLYKRLYKWFGEPTIINGVHVNIGIGDHQTTYLLTDTEKESEALYMKQKYA